jgi:hypothetical protein
VCVRNARRARDDGHHLSGEASEVVAGLPVRDLVELSETPDAGESGDLGLRVSRGRAGERRRLVGLGLRHSGLERLVDEETPYLLVGNTPDELFDVDAAVAERPPVPVRLGDLGLERDDALEPGSEVRGLAHPSEDAT